MPNRGNFHLAAAIEQDHLALHFQPRICAHSLQVIGAEALLRWNPTGEQWIGVSALSQFEAPEFSHLWSWKLEQVRTAFATLRARGWQPTPDYPEFFISLNLSHKQIASHAWVEQVLDLLDDCGVPGQCLEVELTEQGAVHDFPFVSTAFELLRNAGVTIALDDFPEGGSSFLRLSQFKFDKVKIDRTLVPQLGDPVAAWLKKRQLVSDFIGMIGRTGASVVVEGIERDMQHKFFRKLDVAEWQGFHWGGAVSLDALVPRIACLAPGTTVSSSNATPEPANAATFIALGA